MMYERLVNLSSLISCFILRKKITPSVPNLLQAKPTRATATLEELKEAAMVIIMMAETMLMLYIYKDEINSKNYKFAE